MAPFKIGQRVRVSLRHWLRAKDVGRIVECDPRRNHHWLVEFLPRGPGRGIELETGKQGLWLDDSQIEAVSPSGERERGVKAA